MRRARTPRIASRIECGCGTPRAAQCRDELRRKTRPSGLDRRIRPGQTSEDEIVSDKLITTRPYAIRHEFASKKARERQFVALGRGRHGKEAGQDSMALSLVQNRQNDTSTTNTRTLQQGRNRSHTMSLSCRIFKPLCATPKVMRSAQRMNLRCLRARAETWLMVAINRWLDLPKRHKAAVTRISRDCCC